MNEARNMLGDMVSRLFRDQASEGRDQHTRWTQIEALGLPSLMLDSSHGGFDGKWQDAALVARQVGFYDHSSLLLETIAGRYMLDKAQQDIPEGPLTICHCSDASVHRLEDGWSISGRLGNVPWLSSEQEPRAKLLLSGNCEDGDFLALVNTADIARDSLDPCNNLAAQRRASPVLDKTRVRNLSWLEKASGLSLIAALLSSARMAGALHKLCKLSITHCSEREQFGRPLARFQSIQHALAQLTEQAAAVQCAADAAALACDKERDVNAAGLEIAAAKLRANMAVPLATGIAHQVHGAMGFTREHELHRYTNALLAWRRENGSERYCSELIANWCLNDARKGLWASLVERSDRHMLVLDSQTNP